MPISWPHITLRGAPCLGTDGAVSWPPITTFERLPTERIGGNVRTGNTIIVVTPFAVWGGKITASPRSLSRGIGRLECA